MILEDKYTIINFWSRYTKINNMEFKKHTIMKQLPIRLSPSEWEDLQKIRELIGEKTSAKTIKFLIKYFLKTN